VEHEGYRDQPNRSPWIAQLAPDGPPRPLAADADTDVVIVGAGIAGVATAFFALRSTAERVLLVERDRVARGATGRNASQLTTYFERPLTSIAAEFGDKRAAEAQAVFDGAHELLDLMAAESGATVRVERFTGHMGMYSLAQVETHLRCQAVRRAGGAPEEAVMVSEEAPFLAEIAPDLAPFYAVVAQARVRELLEIEDDRYVAVLSARGGCANAGMLVQQVLAYLGRTYPDRFGYVDRTHVDRIVAGDDGVTVEALGHRIAAGRVVLCTNGFVGHEVVDEAGAPVELHPDQRVIGRVAYMAAFKEASMRPAGSWSYIRNTVIGGTVPYVYVTRRTYDTSDGDVTLTCMGGPEYPTAPGGWDAELPFPGAMLELMDEQIRPFAQPARPAAAPYDFQWHGLMGYMDGGVRVIGPHPRHARVLYNLGCNGVGFLPSIAGGDRIARMLAGERFGPSVFDPR